MGKSKRLTEYSSSDSSDEESPALKRKKLDFAYLNAEREKMRAQKEQEKFERIEQIKQKQEERRHRKEGEYGDDDDGDDEREEGEKEGISASTRHERPANADSNYRFGFNFAKREKVNPEPVTTDSILTLVGVPIPKPKPDRRKTVFHHPRDPNFPHRPQSAFKFYAKAKSKEVYDLLLSEGKKPSFTRIMLRVATMWRKLSVEEQLPYTELAIEDKIRFKEDMAKYRPVDPALVFGPESSDSDFGDVDLNDSDYEIDDDKRLIGGSYAELIRKGNSSWTKRLGINAPKSAASSYAIFARTVSRDVARRMMEKYGPGVPREIIFEEVGRLWRKLPEKEKAQYKILCHASMVQYRREFEAYKKKLAAKEAAKAQAERDGVEYVEEKELNYI